MAGIVVNGEPRDLDGVPAAHQRARLPARLRADRRQGGLRRGRVRRLLGHGRPARRPTARTPPSGPRSTPAWCPAAALDGQEVVTVRGALGQRAGRPAPGPARDGGARRLAVRLLHAGLRLQHGRGVLPVRPGGHQRRPGRTTTTTATNGFDLHALSGNLCRCTGYRPIKDAAYALGYPAADDDARGPAYDARAGARRPPGCTTARRRTSARPTWPRRSSSCTTTEATRPWSRAAPTGASRSTCAAARAGLVRRHRPAARAARLHGRRRRGPDRRRADAHRDRAPARRPAAAAGRAVPAVRLAADPQRRHARRQPRHRLADRRRPAGPARARGGRGAGLGRRRERRCRWPTTSPATARPYAARAS